MSAGQNNDLIENYMKLMSKESKAFNSGRSFSMKNVLPFKSKDQKSKVPKRISTIMELVSVISSESGSISSSDSPGCSNARTSQAEYVSRREYDGSEVCPPIEENVFESNVSSTSFEMESVTNNSKSNGYSLLARQQ